MQQKTIVAARYVRNSDTSKMDSEVQQAQADALKAYAQNMGYECPDTLLYKDAISALKHPYWERDGLMRLWDDAERGMFDVVLVTEFFRVARTTAEQYAVMEYLKRFKVELISITEKFDATPEGQLLFAVQGFLGSVEAAKIAIRTARGKLRRASKALTGQGSHPMYGYLYADSEEYTKGRYILNLTVIYVDRDGNKWTEVKVIEFCFDACLRGMSLLQIGLYLTRLGIPTQQGKAVWDPSTIRRFLTNICYTGEGVNGRYAKEHIPIKAPVYPKIVSRETFDAVQQQLSLNAEMSWRNNQHPMVGLLRGLIYCGICGHKMHIRHYASTGRRQQYPRVPDYLCYRNEGVEDAIHHHSISIQLPSLDEAAWKFALPYIRDKTRMRAYVASLRKQVTKRDHAQDINKDIERINTSIANLYALAEVADPKDKDGMEALQQRLMVLQNDKREKERLLAGVGSAEEKQEKLLAALDRFEAWTDKIRPFLDDPTYQISYDDMREAMLVLGVKAVVWPASKEYTDRHELTLLPPDIARFCEYDFTKSINLTASRTIR